MKAVLAIGATIGAMLILSSCATSRPVGTLYTGVKLPVEATSTQEQVTKVGTASCRSILSLVATGDCSLEAAKKDGNINHVNHVDWEADNILGIIGNYQVTVYGH